MTRTEVYNTDYTKLNHAYIQIFETYQKLIEVENPDEDVMMVLVNILSVMNPTLDKIKSEMTVKTRFKDEVESSTPSEKTTKVEREIDKNGGVIFHPKFN